MKKLTFRRLGLLVPTLALLLSCSSTKRPLKLVSDFDRLNIYSPFQLKSQMGHLSKDQKKMVALLIEAADIMDDLFWKQSFSEDKNEFLDRISDPKVRLFAKMNYGPRDRLGGDKPFLEGYGEKPKGAQFYPTDMSKEEFEKSSLKNKKSLYSLIQRDSSGVLKSVPYSTAYKKELTKVAELLRRAARLAKDTGFKNYLQLRAKALLSNSYKESDFAWMDMKSNDVDVVIGPIENYEDQLFAYRAAFEAYVLIKDKVWSQRLEKYVQYLPELQKKLPVPAKYKQETPGTSSDLNAYDVIYYAGHSRAGAKTIAINLPNDEEVQLKKGTRRLQLKNIMRAKFEKILQPISQKVIHPSQTKYIQFDAFFANTMFHEVAHGLGIKKTINGKGPVRQSLKEHSSALEEAKADILGLFMITELHKKGVITEGVLENYYVTSLAGSFRSIRFGASSAHSKADLFAFKYLQEAGAFKRDAQGLYQVNFKKMKEGIKSLSQLILTIQGNGDYNRLSKIMKSSSVITKELSQDLGRIAAAKIPVDIQVIQGKTVLGL